MAETAVQSPAVGEKKGFKDKSLGFFYDVAREMRKVSWPKREELQDATVITLIVCLVVAAFIFGVDKIFETILRFVYRL